MLNQTSTSIALEGIGFNDSTLVAILGFGFANVEIIVPPDPNPHYPELLAGGFSTYPRPIPTPSMKKKPPVPMPINVRITLNGKSSIRTFMVRPSRYRAIVKVVNLMNATSRMINVGIDKIKRTTSATVNVLFGDK